MAKVLGSVEERRGEEERDRVKEVGRLGVEGKRMAAVLRRVLRIEEINQGEIKTCIAGRELER